MKQNQFVVDLGKLKLTEADRQRINAAIQRTAASELAGISTSARSRVVLVPITPKFKLPILWGIIIRDIDDLIFKDIIKKQPIV